jgi:hypothetical protein
MRAQAHVENHVERLKESGLCRFPFSDPEANANWMTPAGACHPSTLKGTALTILDKRAITGGVDTHADDGQQMSHVESRRKVRPGQNSRVLS